MQQIPFWVLIPARTPTELKRLVNIKVHSAKIFLNDNNPYWYSSRYKHTLSEMEIKSDILFK
jgi:hypothetical protein